MSVSIWWLMLALIPVAVLLLAISSLLPHQGALNKFFSERIVARILFAPIPGAPQLSFIKFLLVGISIVTAMCGMQVYNDSNRAALPAQGALDKQLLAQGKGFRNQRNLYLSALALTLWWSVFTVFTLKTQIAHLLDQKDAAAARNNVVAASKSVSSSASSSSVKQRELPKPSAPELSPEPNTNENHLE